MVVPIVIRRVTSRGTVFSVLGIIKGLVADRICKGVASAWGIAQEKDHLINVIKEIGRIESGPTRPCESGDTGRLGTGDRVRLVMSVAMFEDVDQIEINRSIENGAWTVIDEIRSLWTKHEARCI
ncbi:hypothetical protein OROMI_025196 [Orobanche minor]